MDLSIPDRFSAVCGLREKIDMSPQSADDDVQRGFLVAMALSKEVVFISAQ